MLKREQKEVDPFEYFYSLNGSHKKQTDIMQLIKFITVAAF